jgi:hypothetical protein
VRGILRREKQSKCLGLARSISQFGGGWILLQFGEIAGAAARDNSGKLQDTIGEKCNSDQFGSIV